MAVAAVSWAEGVLNNIMNDDRSRNCPKRFAIHVGKVGRAIWRTHDSKHVEKRRSPCYACIQWVHGDEVLWRHEKDAKRCASSMSTPL